MSLSSERMMKLMAYADGELEGAELDEVEGWLSTDPDALRFAEDIANLGGLVKTGHEGSSAAKAVASFDIADAVVQAATREKPAGNVVSLAAQRQKRLGVAAVAAALALAASVFLMNRQKNEVPMAQGPVPGPAVAAVSNELGVEVEPVESQGESVQVFYLANEGSRTTSVLVWVDEPGAK